VRKTGDGSVTTHTKTADQTWAAARLEVAWPFGMIRRWLAERAAA
jgi:hypothetical protein